MTVETKIKKNLPYIIILVIALTATAFAAVKFLSPKKTDQASQQTADSSQGQPNNPSGRQGGRGGNRGNFQRLHGTVASVSDTAIVMTVDDKSSKTINCDSTTRIMKQENGQTVQLSLSDVQVGSEINIMGGDPTQSNITPRMIIIGTFTPPQNGGSWQGRNSQNSNYQQPTDSSSSQI